MSKPDATPSDWDGLIAAAARELELARVRVKELKSVVRTFEELYRQGQPFPGQSEAGK